MVSIFPSQGKKKKTKQKHLSVTFFETALKTYFKDYALENFFFKDRNSLNPLKFKSLIN